MTFIRPHDRGHGDKLHQLIAAGYGVLHNPRMIALLTVVRTLDSTGNSYVG